MQALTTSLTSAFPCRPPGITAPGALNGWASLGRALMPMLLDELDFGLIVCAIGGTVLLANWAAQQEFSCGRWISAPKGVLGGRAFSALCDAIAAAVQRGRRQLVCLASGDERMFVSVSPLAGDDGSSHALLALGRRSPCSRLGLELLAGHFKLTDSERRVLTGLVAQRSAAQLAQDHGVAVCTVRTQISTLQAKLGVNGLRAMLCLVAGVPTLATALRAVVGPAAGSGGERAASVGLSSSRA